MKKRSILLGLAITAFSPLSFADNVLTDNVLTDVVLSEVLYDAPNNDSTEEYIELFNASCSAIDLSNYKLQDNGSTYVLSGTIAPNSYFSVAKNDAAYFALFNQHADANDLSLTLGNSGDYIKLLKNNTVIDTVAWENGLANWPISTKDKSIYRTSLSTGNTAWAVSANAGSTNSGSLSFDCTPVIDNQLLNNQPKTGLSANKGQTLDFVVNVPVNSSKLTINMTGNNGDADLTLSLNNVKICKPYLNGSNEQCSVSGPAAGVYTVAVNAYQAFSALSLVAIIDVVTIEPQPANTILTNALPVSGIVISTGEQTHYQFDVPADASNLSVAISGGTGDADLYLQFDKAPTTSSNICRPYLDGNDESCDIAAPSTGRYHIMVNAYSAVDALTLTASFVAPIVQPTEPTDPPSEGYQYDMYYQTAISQSGASLKSSLNTIIKDHVRFTYSQAWDGLGYADEDPNNTNNVILLYTNRSEPKINRAGMSNSQDAWNREHVWAKSHGFPSSGQHAYTDFHHLRPADVSVNSARGNKDFLNGGSEISEAPGNFTDADSFEPVNSAKGDVARMIFYMDVRYEGNDNSGTPDLSISNGTTNTGNAQLGDLCTLLQWHNSDPVSDWERRRNQRIFQWQKNRNPFIDNPQWANDLYQTQCQ